MGRAPNCGNSGAGENHASHGRVGFYAGNRITQLGDNGCVQGVQLIGPVDGDPGDTVAELEEEGCGHG